jgi:hypothetical protein
MTGIYELNRRTRELLSKAGLPYEHIHACGNIVTVTCKGRDTADKWCGILSKFIQKVKIWESVELNKVNKNTTLRPSSHTVWKIGGMI